MKTLHVIAFITTGLVPWSSTFGQDSVAVEGKVIATTNKEPIGAYTVKAYPPENASGTSTVTPTPNKPIAQTLTRADGTYSLSIAATLTAVTLRFEKLSYFSVPREQTVQLTSPKTAAPDVAAVKYNYGQTVSAHDLLDAFSIRQASHNAMTINLPPAERENARKASFEIDLKSLKTSGVDSGTITEVTKKLRAP
jgi:hypothetical protein